MVNSEVNTVNLLKNTSVQIVLNAVRRNYPISRLEISEVTELSLPSVSRILTKLLEEGYVVETDSESIGLGRKTKMIRLKDRCVLTVGCEYDSITLKLSIIGERGQTISFKSIDVRHKSVEPHEISVFLYEEIKKIFEEENIDIKRLFGIGIAIPGMVNNENGVVLFSAQLGWRNVKLKEIVESITGVSCVVDNDIKATAVAEYNKGIAKKSKVTVLMYFGSGLGTAVIIDGVIFRGVSNSAGELGHITQDVNGILCNCGKIGCLQTNMASGFLLAEANRFEKMDDVHKLFSKETRREKWAERIANKFITYAAVAIDTAVCAYNPDTVILCGDIIDNSPELLSEISNMYYNNYMSDYQVDRAEIKRSSFNGKGSTVGSGILAQEKFFVSL